MGTIEVEDTMSAYIRYKDAVANFYVSTSYVDNVAPLIEVVCENAIIRIEDQNVTVYEKGQAGRTENIEYGQPTIWLLLNAYESARKKQ